MRGIRQSFAHTLKRLGKIDKAVEVGVREGHNAKTMLENGVGFLYLIDPYIPCEETWDHEKPGQIKRLIVPQRIQDWAKKQMLDRLSSFNGKKEFLEMTSLEAVKRFPDGEFDYIYIDANHDYPFVKDDLNAWFPKVKKGGVLAGHDFEKKSFPGVVTAVMEFAKEKGLKVVINNNDTDWWINL